MTEWQIAMLCLLPLMAGHGSWAERLWQPRLRVWLVLAGANLAAYIHQSLPFYIAVDLVAGAIVLSHPRCLGQRIIGALFTIMAMFSIGFFASLAFSKGGVQEVSSAVAGADMLTSNLVMLGWLQWLVLALWGAGDAWQYLANRAGTGRGVLAAIAGRVR